MANVPQTVTVCQELQTCLSVLTGIVSDIKSGKAAATVVADAMPNVVGALAGLGQLNMEVTAANGSAVDTTVAMFAVNLKQVLLPGVV